MKRSKNVSLILMAAVSGAVAVGCDGNHHQNKPLEPVAFKSAEECLRSEADFTAEQCMTGFEQAKVAAALEAPGFETIEDCEMNFGVGKCATREQLASLAANPIPQEQVAQASSSGGSFAPFMWGYMMGSSNSASLSSSAYRYGHPVVRHGNGTYSAFKPLAPNTLPVKAWSRGADGKMVANSNAYTTPKAAAPNAYKPAASYSSRGASSSRGGFGGRSGGFGG